MRREFVTRGIQVTVYADRAQAGFAAAEHVAAEIQRTLAPRGAASVVFAAAPSQNEFLAELSQRTDLDWQKLTAPNYG